MADSSDPQRAYVILTCPTDPNSIFMTDLRVGQMAVCVFSRPHHALLFAKNVQGIDPAGMVEMDTKQLRLALEARKPAGATHVVLDPPFDAGQAAPLEIDNYISSIKVK